MSKALFIFTTRYLGKDYPFGDRADINSTTPLYSYLKNNLINPEILLELIKFNKMTQNDLMNYGVYIDPYGDNPLYDIKTQMNQPYLKDNYDKLADVFISKGIAVDAIKEKIKDCVGNDLNEKLLSRFSYYTLKNDPNANAFAVPHLNWRADKEWIKVLIEWSFLLDTSQDLELFLVMHDKDVPGFQNEPYKYLLAEQTYNLLQNQERNNNNIILSEVNSEMHCYYNKRKINILAFQHTNNDVVDILNNSTISFQGIKDKLMIGNMKNLNSLFSTFPTLPTLFDFKRGLKSLKPECSVDVCNNTLDLRALTPKELKSQRNYYVYNDNNGAILNELMHTRNTVRSSRQLISLVSYLRKSREENVNDEDLKKMHFPLIIKIYYSFFDYWENELVLDSDKKIVRNHRNKKAMEENLERVFSFICNSSIWVRLVDIYDEKAFETAVSEFEYFDRIGLYDYNSAWENLEYNTRIFTQNYLESALEGHGNYITPLLYGDETIFREILINNRIKKG